MSTEIPARVYFVGIGGIGMSALARYFHARGSQVSGYDLRETDLTRELVSEGMPVHYEDQPDALPEDIDLAIYTPAVPSDFGELEELRARGVKLEKRAKALGRISRRHSTLAVAGTHGKTSISAMAIYLMREGDTDAVGFLGGITANYDSNYIAGEGEWMVVEADEYDRSFLHLDPDVTIVSFIEPDHLDIYTDVDTFEDGFHRYLAGVKAGGTVVTKPHIAERLERSLRQVQVVTYGLDRDDVDWSAHRITVENGTYVFTLRHPGGEIRGVKLGMPGRHNVENAVAALAATHAAGLDVERAAASLSGFLGVQRRFERLGVWKDAVIISDYAHHPTEVSAAIACAKELFADRPYRIVGIFQPHLYSRTRDFADGFAAALSDLQEVVMFELYPARETPIVGISSMTIFDNVSVDKKYLVSTSEAPALLEALGADVLLFMGAGDVDAFARKLVSAG